MQGLLLPVILIDAATMKWFHGMGRWLGGWWVGAGCVEGGLCVREARGSGMLHVCIAARTGLGHVVRAWVD